MEKIKQKKNVFLLLAFAVVVVVGGAFAYFWDADEVTNSFTVGDVKIQVEEDNWDENNAKNITPNATIVKDPKIKNIGNNDAYMFMTVDVPKKNIVVANEDGSLKDKAMTNLFSYTINEGWKLIESKDNDGYTTYTYAYMSDNLTTVAPNVTTGTLFNNVTFVNAVESLGETNLDIVVKGFAVQTTDLGTTDAKEVWEIVNNQNSTQG